MKVQFYLLVDKVDQNVEALIRDAGAVALLDDDGKVIRASLRDLNRQHDDVEVQRECGNPDARGVRYGIADVKAPCKATVTLRHESPAVLHKLMDYCERAGMFRADTFVPPSRGG